MHLRAFAYRLALEQGRLEDALGELSRLLREGNDVAARRRLSRFRTRFERYVQGEERLLFPVLEAQGARPFVATSRMRVEHGLLRRLVASLRDAIDTGHVHVATPLFGDRTLRLVLMADPLQRTAEAAGTLLRRWMAALEA